MSRNRVLLLITALVVMLGLAVSAVVATTSTAARAATRPTALLSPASGAMVGAYVDLNGDGSATQAEMSTRESQIGRTFAIDVHFYSWTNSFPGSSESTDVANGRVPLITWEPWNLTLDQIANGSQDSVIISHAQSIKAFGKPIFLRFMHEMNGNWYPWDGSHNSDSPAKYIAAWRHVHDVFAAQGVKNVAWVWCPNASDVPNQSWNHWTNYYPGDNYVDWVGIDGYNWGTNASWSSWQSFAKIMSPIYQNYAATKPIIIPEFASTENGGSKAQWITDAAAALQSTFPSIEAVCWFDKRSSNLWYLDSSSSSLSSFKTAANTSYLSARAGSTTTTSPSPSPTTTTTSPSPSPTTTTTSPSPSPTSTTTSPSPSPTTTTTTTGGTPFSVRINAGSTGYTGPGGAVWSSDTDYSGGFTYSTTHGIAGAKDQQAFQSERAGMSGYAIPVPQAGVYRVTLDLAEIYWTAAGKRIFSVTAEGQPAVSNIDIYKLVGGFRALEISFDVNVTDGVLNLGFTASVDHPKVDGIQVTAL
jgi:hypothetical protein